MGNSQRVSFTHPTHSRVLRNRLEHFCFARPLPEPLMCATLGATAAAARSPLSKSCRKSNGNPFFHFSKKQSTYNLLSIWGFNHQTIWEWCGQSIYIISGFSGGHNSTLTTSPQASPGKLSEHGPIWIISRRKRGGSWHLTVTKIAHRSNSTGMSNKTRKIDLIDLINTP